MQTIIQYKQLANSIPSSRAGLEKTKTTGISGKDLMGLSWIFLDEDFTSQFNGGPLNCQ